MQTNGLNLTCTQTILSHYFDFILQGCLGEWDRASTRLLTYFYHRGSGQDVVKENLILKKNYFFFFWKKTNLHFFLEQDVILWITILENHVFKNQTNLFNYEGSRSLNWCNQNLFLSFEHCQIKSPKAIKNWNMIIFRNHIVGWKQGECSKFEISF